MRFRIITLVTALTALIAGCGGGDGPVLIGVTVSPEDFVARVGDVVSFTASGHYSNDTQRLITNRVSWSSTDPSVGSVSSSGQFTAQSPGQTQVCATKGDLTGNLVTVTVEPVPALPTADYMPLAEGNQWTYTGTQVTTDGVHTRQVQITLVVTVIGQAVRNGATWYELRVKGSDPLEPPGQLLMRHDPEGLVRHDPYGSLPVKTLDAALNPGTTWEDPEDPRRTFLIESTSESVDVPAGSYDNCVKVVETDTYYDPPNVVTVWYKAGVGLVWQQQYNGDELWAEQKLVEAQFGSS